MQALLQTAFNRRVAAGARLPESRSVVAAVRIISRCGIPSPKFRDSPNTGNGVTCAPRRSCRPPSDHLRRTPGHCPLTGAPALSLRSRMGPSTKSGTGPGARAWLEQGPDSIQGVMLPRQPGGHAVTAPWSDFSMRNITSCVQPSEQPTRNPVLPNSISQSSISSSPRARSRQCPHDIHACPGGQACPAAAPHGARSGSRRNRPLVQYSNRC